MLISKKLYRVGPVSLTVLISVVSILYSANFPPSETCWVLYLNNIAWYAAIAWHVSLAITEHGRKWYVAYGYVAYGLVHVPLMLFVVIWWAMVISHVYP